MRTVTSREILCGLSYADLVSCAGMSQKEAAEKLGVGYNHFNQKVKRLGLGHWYQKPTQAYTNCVSKEDIIKVAGEGYTMKDAAFLMGICDRHMKRLVALWRLAPHFPNSGKAAWISRKGYCHG